MPWQEYAALPGYSFSYLKREVGGQSPYFTMTDKMRLGSLVDAILMQPDEINMKDPLFSDAKLIAGEILAIWGKQIAGFKCQMSYSGAVNYAGVSMQTKGRSDWELPGHAIVDLKITEATDVRSLIMFMGYDNQQNNYCALAGVPVAYILAYNPKLRRCLPLVSLPYNPDNQFWKDKVLKFGNV